LNGETDYFKVFVGHISNPPFFLRELGEFQVLGIIFGFKACLHLEICIEIGIKDGIENKLH
jgi:hypothetical protein